MSAVKGAAMLRALWRGWLRVAGAIGHVQSLVVLGLAYFVVVAPFAIAIRLSSDRLGLRALPSWQGPLRAGDSAASLSSMRQQF